MGREPKATIMFWVKRNTYALRGQPLVLCSAPAALLLVAPGLPCLCRTIACPTRLQLYSPWAPLPPPCAPQPPWPVQGGPSASWHPPAAPALTNVQLGK